MRIVTSIVAVMAITGTVSAGTATWQGGAGNWLGNPNWDVDGTPNQNLPNQTTSDDDIIINEGATVYNPANASQTMGLGWGASTVTLNGGSISQPTDTREWKFNGTGGLTINGGSMTRGGGNVVFGDASITTDSASFLLSGGSFTQGSGEFKVLGGNTAEVAGGTFTAGTLIAIGESGFATFDISGGTVRLNSTAVFQNGIFTQNSSYIDFIGTAANGAVFSVGNVSVADAISFYLDTDKVRAGGSTDNALFNVQDDGLGGVNISLALAGPVVPAPAAFPAGLGLLTILTARRRIA